MIKWTTSDAYRVLKRDPVMKKIIRSTGELDHGIRRDVYFAMMRSIASQQLSVKAAETIFNRFLDLFPGRKPTPELVTKLDVEKMRLAGLSYSKSGYLKNIAVFSSTHGLEYTKLNRMDDEELITYLTTIKGVGRWTAEMILMFTMNRPDVLPVDDLGIRKTMQLHYNLKGDGKKLTSNMMKTAEAWRPYRTLACRHLWYYKDGE